MDDASHLDRQIAAIAALDQPLRRQIHRLLASEGTWVSRDDAAAALDVARSVAAFHLDKLVEAGLVEVRFERTSGRKGPGAGRPAKLYRLRADEVVASVPERHYDLAGSLLARAVADSSRTGADVRVCLRAGAREVGEQIGEEAADEIRGAPRAGQRRQALLDLLAQHGYEPVVRRGEIELANCPFHRLAEEQRELVCGMNLDLLEGVLEGARPAEPLTARLDPRPGTCCVRIAAA
jgi:predicted ArsR family transcriptional regulator